MKMEIDREDAKAILAAIDFCLCEAGGTLTSSEAPLCRCILRTWPELRIKFPGITNEVE